MTVVTRFAPSPTGFLHIGGARTALYNWLFAKHHQRYGDGGQFLLRIEDTDRARSTDAAVDAIYDGLKWLGLDWDGDAISQFSRISSHQQAARQLLEHDKAYRCYCSPEELADMRALAKQQGRPMKYDGRWRDRDPADAPKDVQPVVRLKAPVSGDTIIDDRVQGEVKVSNQEIDDMVLLRADGTPTYMLAVVVDDHDMAVSHIIRGDDHLTNAFRQVQIYKALGWHIPIFAHIPLIHGADGAKMSKRHGALGADAYRDQGFHAEALRNYLLRLGWSHGDDEIISTDQAIEWFGLGAIGRSPSKFDLAKLNHINSHVIREMDNERLVDLVMPFIEKNLPGDIAKETANRLKQAMSSLKERVKNFVELAESAKFLAVNRPIDIDEKAAHILNDEALVHLKNMHDELLNVDLWAHDTFDAVARTYAEKADIKLGKVLQPLRSALTGTTKSPSIFEVLEILGRDESLARIDDVL